jgi:hypothetical protein
MRFKPSGARSVIFLVLAFVIAGCGAHSTTAPTPAISSADAVTPAPASPVPAQWSGTLVFSSALPAASCEAEYVARHPELLPQSATAELHIDGISARMNLRTSADQECMFSGSSNGDSLSMSARHETCGGWPLDLTMIGGIIKACHTIAPAGDGPFWGDGTLVARLNSTQEFDGEWTYDVFDPGALGSVPPMRINIGLHLHLVH